MNDPNMSLDVIDAEAKPRRFMLKWLPDRQQPIKPQLSKWLFTKRNTFLVVVVIPCVMAALYYGFIISNQYVAEVRMIVRTIGVSEQFSSSEVRAGRSIIGGDSLTQDSYIVADYLESQEIVRLMEESIGLSALFSRSEIDILSRLEEDPSFERLHTYWQRQVHTYVDGPSGIIVFTLRAFSPEDTLLIMNKALELSNQMIGQISERAKAELVIRAENEMIESLEEFEEALQRVRQYQNETGILDPILQARLTGSIISQLIAERTQLVVQLETARLSNINESVVVLQLERSIEALDRQIELRQASLAGEALVEGQLSARLAEFARLETHRIVQEAIYRANVRNLDTAKSTALRRTTFISIYSEAVLPEESVYPTRLSAWLIFSIGILTVWTTGTLIWLSIQDHRV